MKMPSGSHNAENIKLAPETLTNRFDKEKSKCCKRLWLKRVNYNYILLTG